MRAREFIREFTINVPVTINIPLSDLLNAERQQQPAVVKQQNTPEKEVINPGLRYDDEGDAKWSPPLQQYLDVAKDSVGPTEEDPTIINPEDEFHDPEVDVVEKNDTKSKKLKSLFSHIPSVLG